VNRILYATDGSSGAIAVGEFLAGLPHAGETHIHILTAVDPFDADDTDGEEEGGGALDAARASLGRFPGHITTATVYAASNGEIAETILDSAAEIGAALIAVGNQGRTGIARLFLGSVAEILFHNAPCPILVVRRPIGPLREIMVGVDGSEEAQYAAEKFAAVLPPPTACAIRLVRVVKNPPFAVAAADSVATGSYVVAAQELVDREMPEARRSIDALADEMRAGGRETGESFPIEAVVSVGDPATELLRVAEGHAAGLVVVGSRGLSGLERLVRGSVSQRILRQARCSVLVMRSPDIAAEAGRKGPPAKIRQSAEVPKTGMSHPVL